MTGWWLFTMIVGPGSLAITVILGPDSSLLPREPHTRDALACIPEACQILSGSTATLAHA
eukprot:scaffold238529_cov16-Tisochrysis_lutea.AAC.2